MVDPAVDALAQYNAEYNGDAILDALARLEDNCTDIDGQMIEAHSIRVAMESHGGVNRQLAEEMERLIPGSITRHRPLSSYTHDYSKTNYTASLEDNNTLQRGIIGNAIAALIALGRKLIAWINQSLQGRTRTCNDAAVRLVRAATKIRAMQDLIPTIAAEIQYMPTAIPHIAEQCGLAADGLTHSALRTINDSFQKESNRVLSRYCCPYIIKTVTEPALYSPLIHGLATDIPGRLMRTMTLVDRLIDDIEKGRRLMVENYQLDYTNIKRMAEIVQARTAPTMDAAETASGVRWAVEGLLKPVPQPRVPILDRIEHANYHLSTLGQIDASKLPGLNALETKLRTLETRVRTESGPPTRADVATRAIRSNMNALHMEFITITRLMHTTQLWVGSVELAGNRYELGVRRLCQTIIQSNIPIEKKAMFRNILSKLDNRS